MSESELSEPQLLLIEQHEGIATVGLNRPSQRNAINDDLIAQLEDFFSHRPAGVKVVVLHGIGEHFCAGLDLKELVAKRTDNPFDSLRRSRAWHRTFDLIQFGEVPVVSVLKGAVIGGGLELASATHVRVSEPSTFFQMPEGQRGIFVGGGGSVRIPRIIGSGRMVEMMLTGRSYDHEAGLALGLSHHAAAEGEGLARGIELATAIARNAETANFSIINGIARIQDMSMAEGLFTETMMTAFTRSGSDSSERIKQFFETRKQQND